jgi:UDP-N-acetylmuramate--alanine ligase
MPRIHFIGIGGVGMNGLAQLAIRSGYKVSGSDRAYHPESEPFRTLEQWGIQIFPQDASGISEKTNQVVFSTAIESDNHDLLAAKKHQIPLLHRADFLKQLVGSAPLIAVAGTAGKTTTTGILAWIFEQLGMDPSVYNGAGILNWKRDGNLGNIRKGDGSYWIIEADESDRSFLKFHPEHALITNISKDHYELEELYNLFGSFEKQVHRFIIRGDDEKPEITSPSSFLFQGIEFQISMLGKHNLENAFCAVRLCDKLGMDLERVREALLQFKGIERRLEWVGEVNGIQIIDDYAHNAAKIFAAITAVAQENRRVHVFWRPHGFAPLSNGLNDLLETFKKAPATSIHILPVYYAGGSVTRTVSSADFVNRLQSAGLPATLVPDYPALKEQLQQKARSGDCILGMGARDPELPRFSQQLLQTWKTNES